MSMFSNLHRSGLWNGYNNQVVGLEPVLEKMSARGMPVSQAAFDAVMALLETDMARSKAEMQALVPDSIKKFFAYKREPRKKTTMTFQTPEGQWRRWKEWAPSNKALIEYMRHKGHPVPRDFKSDKETTNKVELARLYKSTSDTLYEKVLLYRKAQTVISNHMKNWKPGADERVHSTFYFDPATGQLSSRRPNVQNAPKRDDPEFGGYAKVFRGMIAARPGYTIVEFDFKSFHAQTLAFEAQDADYLRLAKIDIHSYLAARLVREPRFSVCLSWPDDELATYLSWIKKNHKFVRDEKAKRAILGYGFGMGYRRLFNANKESFDSQRDAKLVLDTLDGAFPVTKAWRETIKRQAHEQGFLVSRFGFIRYFWEVFTWRNGAWQQGGDDAEAAIAFLPANDAFGHIRNVMLELEQNGMSERFGMINNVHDSLVFETPTKMVESGEIMAVKDIMEKRSPVLVNSICPNGLSVEVDAQAGPTWANMKGL